MKLSDYLLSLICGTALVAVITQDQSTVALTSTKVSTIAKATTVRIENPLAPDIDSARGSIETSPSFIPKLSQNINSDRNSFSQLTFKNNSQLYI